jgi:hypothetical protein
MRALAIARQRRFAVSAASFGFACSPAALAVWGGSTDTAAAAATNLPSSVEIERAALMQRRQEAALAGASLSLSAASHRAAISRHCRRTHSIASSESSNTTNGIRHRNRSHILLPPLY